MELLPMVSDFHDVVKKINEVLNGETYLYKSDKHKNLVNFFYKYTDKELYNLSLLPLFNESCDNIEDVLFAIRLESGIVFLLGILEHKSCKNIFESNIKKFTKGGEHDILGLETDMANEFFQFIGIDFDEDNIYRAMVLIYDYRDSLIQIFREMSDEEKIQTLSIVYFGMTPKTGNDYKNCLLLAKKAHNDKEYYIFYDDYILPKSFTEGLKRKYSIK
ncbi:MAG: hypothetical protein EOM59_12390 [Clostridia bacterium]|nr:hypothetical protein [Clostridia bacterium]